MHGIAAIEGLSGSKRTILVVLVRRSAGSAIAIVRAALRAAFDAALKVDEHLAKLWSFERIGEMVSEDISKAELPIGSERHAEKLR